MTNVNNLKNNSNRKRGKNDFGGGNSVSNYIPLTEIEQEFIARLVEQGEILPFWEKPYLHHYVYVFLVYNHILKFLFYEEAVIEYIHR